MKVDIRVQRARLDGRDWRVISPASGTDKAILSSDARGYWREFSVDRRAAYRIGVLWLLAARSRHSIVYLPLRRGKQPADTAGGDLRLDLVLSHHCLQLRASLWPRLRRTLDHGFRQTAQIPACYLPNPASIDYPARRHYRDKRDQLRERIHGHTLFLTGSTPVFQQTADRFFDIAFGAPGSAPGEETTTHYCTEFHWADGTLANSYGIHVQYRCKTATEWGKARKATPNAVQCGLVDGVRST